MLVSSRTRIELGGLTVEEGAAWGGFLDAHAALTRAMNVELEADGGLSLRYYDVLRQLAQSEGGRLRMAELADRVKLTRAGLTGLVSRLEAEGLVRREPDPVDGRGCFAVISEAGERRLAAAHPVHLRSIRERFLGRLSRDEQRALATIWTKLIQPS